MKKILFFYLLGIILLISLINIPLGSSSDYEDILAALTSAVSGIMGVSLSGTTLTFDETAAD